MEQQQQNYGKLPDYNESPGQPDDLSSRSGSTNSQTALQPQNQGYPPQYPQQNQSYPPQNQGYPPQYPPQNQGYPPQYPQYPQQNQGYPQEPPPGYGQPTYYQPPQQPQPLYTQQNVYVQQPQVQIQAGVMPPSNIPGSLFATIFCCFAFGIIASIYASKSLVIFFLFFPFFFQKSKLILFFKFFLFSFFFSFFFSGYTDFRKSRKLCSSPKRISVFTSLDVCCYYLWSSNYLSKYRSSLWILLWFLNKQF